MFLFRSIDALGAEVKFDIWEEADNEMGEEMFREGCDETDQTCVLNDNYDAGADMEKSDLESSFYYSQHPLVVSIPRHFYTEVLSGKESKICRINNFHVSEFYKCRKRLSYFSVFNA